MSLDEILQGQPVKLLKLDAEGAELLILKGFIEHLKGGLVQHVLCEITDSFLKQMRGSSEELYALMIDIGYQAFSCDRSRLSPISSRSVAMRYQSNILFSR